MPWILGKKFTFEAAHKLPNHLGHCRRLHGHSWQMVIYVKGESLQQSGTETSMVMDYGAIKTVVKPLLDLHLDHYYLNETTGLENPTSEELARWIYDKLEPFLEGLCGVQINETCTSQCFYSRSIDPISLASSQVVIG